MSKSTRTRPRTHLSRAALKAYEARRAEEVHRVDSEVVDSGDRPVAAYPASRSMTVTRAQEYATIRSDLRRLLTILAVLTVLLVVATLFLR